MIVDGVICVRRVFDALAAVINTFIQNAAFMTVIPGHSVSGVINRSQ